MNNKATLLFMMEKINYQKLDITEFIAKQPIRISLQQNTQLTIALKWKKLLVTY